MLFSATRHMICRNKYLMNTYYVSLMRRLMMIFFVPVLLVSLCMFCFGEQQGLFVSIGVFDWYNEVS